MSIDGRSRLLASGLNDIFLTLHWYGFKAYPTETEARVEVEYRSAQYGTTRRVSCDPLPLGDWLKKHRGCRSASFESILDRKAEVATPPAQGELALGDLSPAARRSMRPE